MRIKIKQLKILNFKGAANQTIDFSDRTAIAGANATGKTRIFDAFTWCLFGKDSEDRADFPIKSLDRNNQPLHHADHSVTAVLEVDGMEQTFERILREKWVKKKGEEIPVYSGNETVYFVNGVPQQQNEYQKKVESIITERVFKLLTNPFYFNTIMKWQDRRQLLFNMAGAVTTEEILARDPDLEALLQEMGNNTMIDYTRILKAKIKSLKEHIADIPARMDEANRGRKPDPDYAKTEKEIAATEKQIRKLEDLIASEGKRLDNANAENRKKRNQVLDLKDKIIVLMHEGKSKAENLRIEHEMKLNTLNREIQTAENDILRLKDAVEFNQANIKRLADRNDTLREQWREINESTLEFDDKTFCCPTCHRPLEADDVEKEKAQLLGKFNIDKAQKLEDIAGKGNANKEGIERLQAENNKHQLEIRQLEDKIRDKKIEIKVATDSYQKPVEKTEPNPLIKKYQEQIEELEATIAPNDTINTKDLTIETAGLREKLEKLKDLMKIRKHNQEIAERLIELQQQQRDFSQQIADLERQEFKIEKFNRLKAEITEERVNGRFEYVKFKLFNNQVNGGTEETCEAMVNGVPFQGANNAAKINAGIDIINAFSKDFDIYAPIFTDNAEAVNQLLDSPSQMITLYVTKDKELKITHKN